MDDARLEAFWVGFQAETGITGPRPPVTRFGDSTDQQDALAALVVAGRKRATASLALWYGSDRASAPKQGDMHIFTDGAGRPLGVIRTTEVREGPLTSVDDQFACDEGEGDGTRAYWLAEHRRFFAAELAQEGLELVDTVKVTFERFACVGGRMV